MTNTTTTTTTSTNNDDDDTKKKEDNKNNDSKVNDDATTTEKKKMMMKKKKTNAAGSSGEENAAPYPNMELRQKIHRLVVTASAIVTTSSKKDDDDQKKKKKEEDLSSFTQDAKELFEQLYTELENPTLYRQTKMKLFGDVGGGGDTNHNNNDADGDVNMDQQQQQHGGVVSSSSSSIFDDVLVDTIAPVTEDDLQILETKHENTWKELQLKIDDARENAGDMEVFDACIDVARFAARALSYKQSIKAYNVVLYELPKLSSGKKMDSYMECARLASFYDDIQSADQYIQDARTLAEGGTIGDNNNKKKGSSSSGSSSSNSDGGSGSKSSSSSGGGGGGGGDWDRRNRLKVYTALQSLFHRKIDMAATLLLDCIATFSCTEMCTYTEFVQYTILCNILYLPRPQIKTKIIQGPEILGIASEIPIVMKLVQSLYDCDYYTYLRTMIQLEDEVLCKDRYLSKHVSYWLRELHILAYKQFLDAYQSVTLDAMSKSFGVSIEFIDYYASQFIASSRLSAKINKYDGIIITTKPDQKNIQYRNMITKGDHLLNRIQKLSRIVDL